MSVLLTEVRGHVGIMTLNRPESHNAMNAEMFVKMARAWESWAADDNIRSVVITGAGDKAFSAGGDVKSLIPVLTRARKPQNEFEQTILDTHPKVRDVAMLRTFFPKPVIAAINGYCVAGGTEVIEGTDIRICTETATFGLPEVKLSILPAGGSLVRLTRQMPHCKAMEMVLTGQPITAAQALECGFVNYVTSREALMSKALEIANQIGANGPLAVRAAKRVMVESSGLPFREAFLLEDQAWDDVAASQDAKEGPLAFAEKRPPVYTGK